MNERERRLACIAGFIALVVLYLLFVASPLLSRSSGLSARLDQVEGRLQAARQAADAGGAEQELSRLRAEVDYDPTRPPAAHQNRMIRAIGAACNQSGAILVNAVPMDVDENDASGFTRHPVQVQVKGDLQAVVDLLAALGGVHPVMAVERVTMDCDDKTEVFTVQMLLVALTPRGSAQGAA